MSFNKAVAEDNFIDKWFRTIKEENLGWLEDLWNQGIITKIVRLESFKARLVLLNKAHPNIPREGEFRPIAIISHLYKFMQLRFTGKLKSNLKKLTEEEVDFME